jgi:hypothetical protein
MLFSEICGLISVVRPLWREGKSAICSVITQRSEWSRTRNHTLLFHSRLPQPGGPGSRIYIPHEQGGPVIPPGHWVSHSPSQLTDFITPGWIKQKSPLALLFCVAAVCYQSNTLTVSILANVLALLWPLSLAPPRPVMCYHGNMSKYVFNTDLCSVLLITDKWVKIMDIPCVVFCVTTFCILEMPT